MPEKISKGKAFVLCFVSVNGIFIAMTIAALVSGDLSIIPVTVCVTALVTITTAYIGLQIANNGVMGKNWNQEMFDSLNKPEEKGNI